jgi:subtilisin-like proprotein convertase family protein
VFEDLNSSLNYDPGEPAFAGLTVFTDQNDNGQPDQIPLGRIDARDGLPLEIPDQSIRTATLEIPTDLQITDLKVVLADLRHGFLADFIVTLIHPDGTRVVILQDFTIDGDRATELILDEAAPESIYALPEESLIATGTYRPSSPLAPLLGKSARGTWRLEIEDFFPRGTGSLHAWGLIIDGREAQAQAEASGRYSIDALTAPTTRLRTSLPAGRTLLAPGLAYHSVEHDPAQLAPVRDFAVRPMLLVPDDFGIRSIYLEADRIVLEVIGIPHRAHRVQRRADLSAGTWEDASTITPGADGIFIWTDPQPLPPSGKQFYRVVSP